MAVPKQREMYTPALEFANRIGRSFSVRELNEELARVLEVSDSDRAVTIAAGPKQFDKNVEWVNYRQAKQWNVDTTVPEQEVRNFAGSLDIEGAAKGVFVTTARFSSPAREAARVISGGSKFIRLIEKDELIELLIEHEVGVRTSFVVKALDEDYFDDEN